LQPNEASKLLGYYADEDCPGPVVRALREAGFDVAAQAEIRRGMTDDDVLRLSAMAGRILLTRDLGFGRLTILQQLPSAGVVIIRLRGPGDWQARAPRVVDAIRLLGDGAVGHVSILDWHATRTRRLPGAFA
jgi:predicted nuclease of predicted toxin-antitoxin system